MIPVNIWVWKLGTASLEFSFLIAQAGTHIVINMIWGAIFGAIFAKVYNVVPSKGITKGLYYALVVYLITSFHISTYLAAYAIFQYAISMGFGVVQAITYGIILGYLYKK